MGVIWREGCYMGVSWGGYMGCLGGGSLYQESGEGLYSRISQHGGAYTSVPGGISEYGTGVRGFYMGEGVYGIWDVIWATIGGARRPMISPHSRQSHNKYTPQPRVPLARQLHSSELFSELP